MSKKFPTTNVGTSNHSLHTADKEASYFFVPGGPKLAGHRELKQTQTDTKQHNSNTDGKKPALIHPKRKTRNKNKRKVNLKVPDKIHRLFRILDVERYSEGDLPDKKYQGVRVSNNMHYFTSDTSMAKSFVNLNTVYTFRLGGHSTITQTSGVINTFIATDPSSSGVNFPEWSTLSSLFSEFRMKHFQVQFVVAPFNLTNLGTAVSIPPLMICGNLGTAVAPGSYAAVADNADAKLWAAAKDTSKNGYTHSISGTHLNFSQVTTPTTEPYAGAPGSIQIYGSFGSTTQADVVHVLISGVYEFRSRV